MKLKPEQLLPEELDMIECNSLDRPNSLHCQEKIKLLQHIVWLNDIIEDLWKEYVNG